MNAREGEDEAGARQRATLSALRAAVRTIQPPS
jgi:hypothetical protein